MMKYGIIHCPNHRSFTSASKRWEKIAAMLEKYGIEYDMVQSENAGSVERLVTMMINNGYKDIVIVGGDSALNDAVNCLMRVEKHVRDTISLGVIPNGTMNDFASFWGYDYDDIEQSVASLKEHRIRKIDVGCIRYANTRGENCSRHFLNCVDVGLLATIQKLRQETRRKVWSRKLSFVISLLMMIFQKMDFKMKYTINFVTEKHNVISLCIGNARGYGQTPNGVPYNGMLDITVVRSLPMMHFINGMYLFIRGKILNAKRITPYRSHDIELEIAKNCNMSIDGHPADNPVGPINVNVAQEELNFIIESLNSKN